MGREIRKKVEKAGKESLPLTSALRLPPSLQRLYESCRLCPRRCGVNRLKGELGFCREAETLRVSYVGPHLGEEPPITGSRGSGTIFFTGCSLRCSFCQNHQISREGFGSRVEMEDLVGRIGTMVRERGVHNLNMVTPDHFFPHVFRITEVLRARKIDIPVVYNLSGYQSKAMLRMAEESVDIYLPDFKYADRVLSSRLSGCRDYPEVSLEAIAEMVRQKGFLDSWDKDDFSPAKKGVLVRHLVLPGKVENSINALTTLFLEFGPLLPLSLMSQYTPVILQKEGDLDRRVEPGEFDRVYRHALDLGFERLFVQFPASRSLTSTSQTEFLPDFRRENPFSSDRDGD